MMPGNDTDLLIHSNDATWHFCLILSAKFIVYFCCLSSPRGVYTHVWKVTIFKQCLIVLEPYTLDMIWIACITQYTAFTGICPHDHKQHSITCKALRCISISTIWNISTTKTIVAVNKSFSDDHAQHAHYRARCFIHTWNVHPAWCLNKTRPKNICRDNRYRRSSSAGNSGASECVGSMWDIHVQADDGHYTHKEQNAVRADVSDLFIFLVESTCRYTRQTLVNFSPLALDLLKSLVESPDDSSVANTNTS